MSRRSRRRRTKSYNTKQHENEIVRAENKAHGLPPDTDTDSAKAQRQLSNEENGNVGPKPKGRRSRGKRAEGRW